MGMMKIPSTMKTKQQCYNEAAGADTGSVCSPAITTRKKSHFKNRKKLPVKDSDMQNAEMDFLKDMKGYAKNEEEKDESDVFGV